MFKESSIFVRSIAYALIISLLVVCIVYGTSLFYEGDRSSFLTLNASPIFLDPETLKPTNTFRKGHGVVAQLDVTKKEIGCFAEYAYNFSGPVSFQISTGKSRIIEKRGEVTRRSFRSYFQIPKDIPEGDYQIQMSVYPTCDGQERDPFTVFDPVPVIVITD
jgi:hypothetical protein